MAQNPASAINPQNTDQLALAFMGENDISYFPIYYSHDGGDTWTESNVTTKTLYTQAVPSSNGLAFGGGDPVLVFDKNGILHLTWILLDANFDGYMLYATSDDSLALIFLFRKMEME